MTLDHVRSFAIGLSDVTEEPHFAYTSFRVGGKIFATAPPDGEFLHIFLDEAQRVTALDEYPDFLEELRWGKRALGIRVLLSAAKVEVIRAYLQSAYATKAARRAARTGRKNP